MDSVVNGGLEALTTSLQSERKWRNVQSVLPQSFGLVVHVLKEQAQVIEQLQRRVDSLERTQATTASSNLMAALEERVRVDVKRRVMRLRKEVFGSLEQQQTMIQNIKEETKIKIKHQEEADTKVELSLGQLCSKMEERMDELTASTKDELKTLELQGKSMRIQDADRLTKLRQDMAQRVEGLEHKLLERETMREVPVFKEVALASPESQEGGGCEVAIREDLARISQDVREVETRMEKQLAGWRQELMLAIGKKLCKSEITKLLSRKMDAMDAWKQLAEKADNARVEEVACALMDSLQRAQETMMDDVDQLRHLNEAKVDRLELVQVKHNMHNLLSVTESIQHELSALQRIMNEKMTVADVKELLDSQSTLSGLQNAMKQVESAAAGEFATKPQVESVNRQVQAITRQLRSEIYQARYIWKDGPPSTKQTIQWSSQVAAFFTNYSPAIQVLVNGEPAALLRPSTDTKEVTCSPTGGQPAIRRLHHSAGNVAGLAIDVFLALPARALVAISYDLDEKAQGFLNLRKL
ncbi:hypothetical protein PF010_g16352 [Phytophthora fragariae]|uniref:Uncharacterized protein n=2 Tax=Phytophthora fragariae TaxID=53985 RepID=A0A6G0PJ55_9STRA|nr:hypothetical protein PF010_g16352 [Phytophthora fragariae]KAE9247616.1 hypothetical protein PF004_g4231 [Phytophthora fragariae]